VDSATAPGANRRPSTRAFTAGFIVLPGGGYITAGLSSIREGQLADDRSPLVLRFLDKWRRPTAADRKP
jgi:hypothetical protein